MLNLTQTQIKDLAYLAYISDREIRSDLVIGMIKDEDDYTSNFTGALRRNINCYSKTGIKAPSHPLSSPIEQSVGCDATLGWEGPGLVIVSKFVLWLFGIGLAVGWSEELAFRGYLLQNMRDGLGLFWAVILSCLLYGLLHMSNPNSTVLSGLLVAWFGFLRIFGWLRTGQLWFSIGMHVGWNFF